MATHASADKAARQSVKRAARNQRTRSQFKTAVKKFRAAVEAKYDSKDAAKKVLLPLLSATQRVLKKAASKNVIKMETASRQISRLSTAMHRVTH